MYLMGKKTYYKVKLKCSPYRNYPDEYYDISVMNAVLAKNNAKIIKTAKKDIYYICTAIIEESLFSQTIIELNQKIHRGVVLLSSHKSYFH